MLTAIGMLVGEKCAFPFGQDLRRISFNWSNPRPFGKKSRTCNFAQSNSIGRVFNGGNVQ
jgi:hypothetical protein